MSSVEHFQRTVDLVTNQADSFAYHERPGALQRLMPPWERARVVSSDNSLAEGSRVVLELKHFGIPLKWVAEHVEYSPPHRFVDIQLSGPFSSWRHEHRIDPLQPVSGDPSLAGQLRSRLTDAIDYQLPLGSLGKRVGGHRIRRQLEQMFGYRHRVTASDLETFERYAVAPQTIALSGSSGLVGRELAAFLQLAGHRVLPLVRKPSDVSDELAVWNSEADAARLGECQTVIHLAGEPIASGRWDAEKRERIRRSRVEMTRELCQRLARLDAPPRTLLCASATGLYGVRGDETLSEDAEPGDDFLAEVAQAWEQACQPAVDAGIRVVHLRFGLILSPRGGALSKMLLPARLAGGRLGSGQQWWSWIALDDVLRAIYHCLANEQVSGGVNVVAPEPQRNAEFVSVLGKVLGIPALIPAPAAGLRMALGDMADALLLASTRVVPRALQASGFEFQYPQLETALRHLLGHWREHSN